MAAKKKPSLFMGTRILEATDERLVLKILRFPSPLWVLVVALVAAWAAPGVLLYFKSTDAPRHWIDGAIFGGAGGLVFPWAWMQGISLRCSRLASLRGRVELRRETNGEFSLRVNGKPAISSRRRGLFFLENEGINALVLVVGGRTATISHFMLMTGGTNLNYREMGQWDVALADLARGSRGLDETWKADSVVPLVHAVLHVLNLGPQPEIETDFALGCLNVIALLLKWFTLPVVYGAILMWLDHHGNPLASMGPAPSALIIGTPVVALYLWMFFGYLKTVYIGPLNRKAEEMISLCQED
jgi:hypothetical protein